MHSTRFVLIEETQNYLHNEKKNFNHIFRHKIIMVNYLRRFMDFFKLGLDWHLRGTVLLLLVSCEIDLEEDFLLLHDFVIRNGFKWSTLITSFDDFVNKCSNDSSKGNSGSVRIRVSYWFDDGSYADNRIIPLSNCNRSLLTLSSMIEENEKEWKWV